MCVEYFFVPYMVYLAASSGCLSAPVTIKISIKMRAKKYRIVAGKQNNIVFSIFFLAVDFI